MKMFAASILVSVAAALLAPAAAILASTVAILDVDATEELENPVAVAIDNVGDDDAGSDDERFVMMDLESDDGVETDDLVDENDADGTNTDTDTDDSDSDSDSEDAIQTTSADADKDIATRTFLTRTRAVAAVRSACAHV